MVFSPQYFLVIGLDEYIPTVMWLSCPSIFLLWDKYIPTVMWISRHIIFCYGITIFRCYVAFLPQYFLVMR